MHFFYFCKKTIITSLLFSSFYISAQIRKTTALVETRRETIVREQVIVSRWGDDPLPRNASAKRVSLRNNLIRSFSDHFSIIAEIVFANTNFYTCSAAEKTRRTVTAFEDLEVVSSYRIWHENSPERSYDLNVLAGLKFPTGSTTKKDRVGLLPRSLQPGTGSWDVILSTILNRKGQRCQLDITLEYFIRTEYKKVRFGSTFEQNISWQFRLFPWNHPKNPKNPCLYLILEADSLLTAKRRVNGIKQPNTGGYTIFITPALILEADGVILETAIDLPGVIKLNGYQTHRKYSALAGIRITF